MSEHTSSGYRRTWIDYASEVPASIGEVFAMLADLDRWPTWVPGLTEIHRSESGTPPRVGSKFTMKVRAARFSPPLPVTCVVTKVEPNRFIEWGGGALGAKLRHSFAFSEVGPQVTRVHQLEYATNAIAVLGRVAESSIYQFDSRWQKALEAQFEK
ncbi:MAG TPA: SRPBCC family protein [Polyangiales bacterium]